MKSGIEAAAVEVGTFPKRGALKHHWLVPKKRPITTISSQVNLTRWAEVYHLPKRARSINSHLHVAKVKAGRSMCLFNRACHPGQVIWRPVIVRIEESYPVTSGTLGPRVSR